MTYRKRMAYNRADLKHDGLKDLVNINEWFDQRNEAAEKLISLDTIALLRKEEPKDRATPLAMMATYFLMEPFVNPNFTNPLKMVEYVWRGLAIWEQQEAYVVHALKSHIGKGNKKLHCPSYQL